MFIFKSKWQKRYELAMQNIEFWGNYYQERQDRARGVDKDSFMHALGYTMATQDILNDMKRIAKKGR